MTYKIRIPRNAPSRKQKMTLYRHETTISGDKSIPEEVEVIWYKTSEATIYLSHAGVKIKDCVSYSDYYGYLTCISRSDLLASIKHMIEKYGIEEDSTLKVEVVLSIYEKPCFDSGLSNGFYTSIPDNYSIKVEEGEHTRYQSLEDKQLVKDLNIYQSFSYDQIKETKEKYQKDIPEQEGV